jgi:hypothetical protein
MKIDVELLLAVAIPLLFWVLDSLIKVLGQVSIEDVGADLCLFGVSFNVTTLLTRAFKFTTQGRAEDVQWFTLVFALVLGASLILYVFAILLLTPTSHVIPAPISWLRGKTWKVKFTSFVGALALSGEIIIYLKVF